MESGEAGLEDNGKLNEDSQMVLTGLTDSGVSLASQGSSTLQSFTYQNYSRHVLFIAIHVRFDCSCFIDFSVTEKLSSARGTLW